MKIVFFFNACIDYINEILNFQGIPTIFNFQHHPLDFGYVAFKIFYEHPLMGWCNGMMIDEFLFFFKTLKVVGKS
tara:strand:+ start:21588 stop:21812 length:225 start_codon:yes stop_codon:yes gene_type:complete